MNNNAADENCAEVCESAPLSAIYIGREAATGRQFLMRKADLQANCGLPPELLKEAYFLKTLKSTFTPLLLDIVSAPNAVFFLTDYCGQTLSTAFPDQASQVALGVLEALEYFQTRGIAHLALCPECIFVDDDVHVRVDGFFHSLKVDPEQRNRAGEYHFNAYTSPELLNPGTVPTGASDMWSFALIFLCLLRKRLLRPVQSKEELLAFIEQLVRPGENAVSEAKLIEWAPGSSPSQRNLLQKLLRLDPSTRLSPSDAKSHPCFEESQLED